MGSWGKDPDALAKARTRLTFGDALLPGDGRLVIAYIERLEMELRQLKGKKNA